MLEATLRWGGGGRADNDLDTEHLCPEEKLVKNCRHRIMRQPGVRKVGEAGQAEQERWGRDGKEREGREGRGEGRTQGPESSEL